MKTRKNEFWTEQAACRGRHDIDWFPERGDTAKEAKAVCGVCPVKADCLEYAMRTHQDEGIYGGLSAKQRLKIKRERRRRVLYRA